MLYELIYFRRKLISYSTGHVNKKNVIEFIELNPNIACYMQDFLEGNSNLMKMIEFEINKRCKHEVIEDFIENAQGEMYKIKYCKHCELNIVE